MDLCKRLYQNPKSQPCPNIHNAEYQRLIITHQLAYSNIILLIPLLNKVNNIFSYHKYSGHFFAKSHRQKEPPNRKKIVFRRKTRKNQKIITNFKSAYSLTEENN